MQSRFYRNHLLYPAIAWLAAIAAIRWLHVDLVLADWLFELEGRSWALRDHWLIQNLLHRRAQDLARLVGAGLLAAFLLGVWVKPLRRRRRALVYLFAATITSTLIIAAIKSISGVPCVWNLARYGGNDPYITIWNWSQLDPSRSGCFPGAHAGVGYAWVALYFLSLQVAPRWRWATLAGALILGLVFGVAQQLRGAHFLSHDLWSLAICWTTSLLWYVSMYRARF